MRFSLLRSSGSRVSVAVAVATVAAACVYPTPPPGDPVPALALTRSSEGAGVVTVTATPANYDPPSIRFYLDHPGGRLGTPIETDDTPPFDLTLSTAEHGPGPHEVLVQASDGEYSVTETIDVVLERPNVVWVMVDDLDEMKMPYWDAMPKTRALLQDQGLRLENAFVVDPTCCPSRATFLTGRYAHNTGVWDNSAPDGGYQAFSGAADDDTVATRLQAEGYSTAYVGKYLNGYPNTSGPIPPGWDEWFALTGFYWYGYAYGANHNGVQVEYGTDPGDYQTDVLADVATMYIDGTEADDEQPFFLTVAPIAPHSFIPPAPRHQPNPFAGDPLPASPNTDEADVSDKPTWLREGFPAGDADELDWWTEFHRRGMGSLLAVDDLVDDVAATLDANGELDDTIFVLTSDNGMNLLSHRLGQKMAPYEESIRIPWYVAGPGVRIGTESHLVTNLDLAPTVLHLAGAGEQPDLDGRSIVPLLRGDDPPSWRSDFLIELKGTYTWYKQLHTLDDVLAEIARSGRLYEVPTFRALRTTDRLYVEWYGGDEHEYELYDLVADPYQLDNLVATPEGAAAHAAETAALQARLEALGACSGPSCRS